jgi:dTDP-4-amino-4,6-dideoxygalactose transaminase
MDGREFEFMRQAFAGNYIAPLGPEVNAFEQEFAEFVGLPYCLALSSGTAAMHLALAHLGVGPGDEVLASTLTFIGSVSPICFLGAEPVFIDSELKSWNMDPALLKQELENCAHRGKLPKAVVPTDLYGQCADYDQILSICNEYNVPVIMDAAEALGATYQQTDPLSENAKQERQAGSGGRAGVYSFNGNKIITTSGGGMLASEDKELIDHARKLSQQAREPVAHYEHQELGYNYRMSNILAAIGRGQLQVLPQRIERKREIFDFYRQSLEKEPGISFMPEASYGRCNRWLTVICIEEREFGASVKDVRLALEKENIESRPVWKPMHLQPIFDCQSDADVNRNTPCQNMPQQRSSYKARAVRGQVSQDLFAKGLCLPSGTALKDSDLQRIVNIIIRCRN